MSFIVHRSQARIAAELEILLYLEALTASKIHQHQLAILLHWLTSHVDNAASGAASAEQRCRLKLESHDAVATG